jgi:hypothetical protein
MVTELLDTIVSWRSFAVALLVFGFAPGALLRMIVLAFHRDDPRRSELLAELHAVPRIERPFWVVEQLEVALFEGILGRLSWPQVEGLSKRKKRSRFALKFSTYLGLSDQVVHVDYWGKIGEISLANGALYGSSSYYSGIGETGVETCTVLEYYPRVRRIKIISTNDNRYVARIVTDDGEYRLVGAGQEFWNYLQKLNEHHKCRFKFFGYTRCCRSTGRNKS